ncbi:DUF2334 domain-containing protein [Streptomyces sp. L7]
MSGLSRIDLKGWAKAQLTADKARHDRPHKGAADLASPTRLPLATPSTVTSAGESRGRRPSPPRPAPRPSSSTTRQAPTGSWASCTRWAAANLAGHFGSVTAKPVQQYTAGMVNSYTAVVYIGSTYYGGDVPDAVPAAFYQDAMSTTKPVTWIGANIWGMANADGVAQFSQKYGWDPTTSYYEDGGSVGTVNQVVVQGADAHPEHPGRAGRRCAASQRPDGCRLSGGHPLAEGLDSSNATHLRVGGPLRPTSPTSVRSPSSPTFPETDRVIAFEDLLFDALAPATPEQHRAMVRLEDISPNSDPTELRAMADYLYSQHIPYGINVIPVYTDPKGTYNNGVAWDIQAGTEAAGGEPR